MIQDRSPDRRVARVGQSAKAGRGGTEIEFLPADPPEWNPAADLWGCCKPHELADFCLREWRQLGAVATAARKTMRRKCRLLMSAL